MRNLMGTLLCCIALATCLGLSAQTTPDWLWVSTATGGGAQCGQSITTDSQGNLYVTGHFDGTTVFGSTTLVSSGDYDIYAAKLDGSGNWLWAVKAGGSGEDFGRDIAVDNAGNVYLTGSYKNTANFGDIQLTSNGNRDIFAAKLDTNGNWLWAVGAGSTGEDQGYGIAVDTAGNACITGYIYDTTWFGATQLVPYGYTDSYVALLDTAGNWLWAVKAGGTNADEGRDVAIDASGNIYATGTFRGNATFGTHSLSSLGSNDVYAAKLDSSGNWLWAKGGGGDQYYDESWGIAVDSSGNSCITGLFYGTAHYGDFSFTSVTWQHDVFVAKLDTQGNWLWANHAGGIGTDTGLGVAMDDAGGVYVTGNFQDTIAFGTIEVTGRGLSDIFAAGLDNAGNWIWAVEAGSIHNDFGYGIALDGNSDIFLHGYFSNTAWFGPISLATSGGFDIYVAKLSFSGSDADDELAPETNGSSFLYDPWPNPVPPGGRIQVKARVALSETASLELYNLRGQRLEQHLIPPGEQERSLNLSGLPSGVYICCLRTTGQVSSKKLILLR